MFSVNGMDPQRGRRIPPILARSLARVGAVYHVDQTTSTPLDGLLAFENVWVVAESMLFDGLVSKQTRVGHETGREAIDTRFGMASSEFGAQSHHTELGHGIARFEMKIAAVQHAKALANATSCGV